MRPRYESEADRAREAAVADEIARATGWVLKRADGEWSAVDYFVMHEDVPLAGLEIKARTMHSKEHQTAFLSHIKWTAALDLVQERRIALVVAYAMTDGVLLYFHPDPDQPEPVVKVGGRTRAPRDAGDIEKIVHLPFSAMVKISDFNVHRDGVMNADQT